MESRFLIDTNVVIDFIGNRLPGNSHAFVARIIDGQPILSVINKIELLSFSIVPAELVELIELSKVIDLSDDIINLTISIRTKYKLKLPDAIIAASAISAGLTLLTRNDKDFARIDNLTVVNPWNI